MKRLLTFAIIIGIIAYVSVQYLKDRRFNPPADYDFPISDKIDTEFYDSLVLKTYFKTAMEVGSYARSLWRNQKIDVRFMEDENFESSQATEYYELLRATALMLQGKLEKSASLKSQGYTNEQVRLLFEQGLTLEDLEFAKHDYLIGLQRGDAGSAVWDLQKLLNASADSIPQDGIFNLITTNRLKVFQQSKGLFPSGIVDKKTLKALIQ
uniref:peptidoglycan-binding domain-containing protein n=1 Tax=Roseivirga sp. TaxID=1964215 RepID=UPI004057B513